MKGAVGGKGGERGTDTRQHGPLNTDATSPAPEVPSASGKEKQ